MRAPRERERHAATPSQPRVDGLALEREHAEHTLVDESQRRLVHEPLERLESQAELANREAALSRQPPRAQPLEVLLRVGLRPGDGPQVFAPAALAGRR